MRLVSASVLLGSVLWGALPLLAQTEGGLKTALAVDTIAGFPVGDDSESLDKLLIRGVEAAFYAPIDPHFDGYLAMAAHPEGDETFGTFEIHEAYLSSTKLVPNSRFRLGQFFLGIGRLNQFHPHDWPFVTAPIAHARFLDEEGVVDSGFEWSTLVPADFYLDLTFGVTNGRTFGHAHEEGERPRVNTHYARAVTYFEPLGLATQTGVSYLGRTSAEGESMTLLGWDWVSKVREGKFLRWLWQSEVWHRRKQIEGADADREMGLYGFLAYGMTPTWSLGVRGDYLTSLSAKNRDGSKASNYEAGSEVHVAWKSSEFMTFRLAFHRIEAKSEGLKKSSNQEVMLQSTFILGAHPAHEF